jgi:hypothetical protein
VFSCRVIWVLRELGARKKKVEGQKHGQKGLFVTEYVEDVREDPLAGVRDDMAADGSEDKMWAALGVVHRVSE